MKKNLSQGCEQTGHGRSRKGMYKFGDNIHFRFDNKVQGHCQLGRIVKLMPDKMGIVRTVQVALMSKSSGVMVDYPNQTEVWELSPG